MIFRRVSYHFKPSEVETMESLSLFFMLKYRFLHPDKWQRRQRNENKYLFI